MSAHHEQPTQQPQEHADGMGLEGELNSDQLGLFEAAELDQHAANGHTAEAAEEEQRDPEADLLDLNTHTQASQAAAAESFDDLSLNCVMRSIWPIPVKQSKIHVSSL